MELIMREIYDLPIKEHEIGLGISYGTVKAVW